MWLFSCFLLFILTTPAWAQPQPPAAGNLLTLEEAVNIALQDRSSGEKCRPGGFEV